MSGAQLDALRQATLAAPAAIESTSIESIEQAIQAIETASAAVQAETRKRKRPVVTAHVLRSREAARPKKKPKRQKPAASKPERSRDQLGLDSSSVKPFWTSYTKCLSAKLPSVAFKDVQKVTAPTELSQHWFRVEKSTYRGVPGLEGLPTSLPVATLPPSSDELDFEIPITRTYRLYPSTATQKRLREFMGVTRYAYNFGVALIKDGVTKLDEWRASWRTHSSSLDWMNGLPKSLGYLSLVSTFFSTHSNFFSPHNCRSNALWELKSIYSATQKKKR